MKSPNSGLPTQGAVASGRGLTAASGPQRRARKTDCTCGHPELVHGSERLLRAVAMYCRVVGCTCQQYSTAPKRQKYNAVRCVGPLGELYDSKAERDYARILFEKDEALELIAWSWAPRFVLQDEPLITYRPDFVVWPLEGGMHVVDVKGHAARDFSLRVRLWKSRYPNVPLCVVKNGEEIWQ
jgi:hypothetical protein